MVVHFCLLMTSISCKLLNNQCKHSANLPTPPHLKPRSVRARIFPLCLFSTSAPSTFSWKTESSLFTAIFLKCNFLKMNLLNILESTYFFIFSGSSSVQSCVCPYLSNATQSLNFDLHNFKLSNSVAFSMFRARHHHCCLIQNISSPKNNPALYLISP